LGIKAVGMTKDFKYPTERKTQDIKRKLVKQEKETRHNKLLRIKDIFQPYMVDDDGWYLCSSDQGEILWFNKQDWGWTYGSEKHG